jgi:hypothetical protein
MCGEFLYQLSNCWLLRNDFSSWNQHTTLKTVGMLGCGGEEVVELTCAESNAENLSTWNCSVSLLFVPTNTKYGYIASLCLHIYFQCTVALLIKLFV